MIPESAGAAGIRAIGLFMTVFGCLAQAGIVSLSRRRSGVFLDGLALSEAALRIAGAGLVLYALALPWGSP